MNQVKIHPSGGNYTFSKSDQTPDSYIRLQPEHYDSDASHSEEFNKCFLGSFYVVCFTVGRNYNPSSLSTISFFFGRATAVN